MERGEFDRALSVVDRALSAEGGELGYVYDTKVRILLEAGRQNDAFAIADTILTFGLSDGGAHCGVISDASFPTTLIQHWGRDRTRGPKLPLEKLVTTFPFDRINEAVQATEEGDAVKAVLTFD